MRASGEHFRLLVEGVKDYGIFMLDNQGTVISWNSGAERIEQYKSEEIVGNPFTRLYTPEDVAAGNPQLNLQRAAEQGSYQEVGWRVRKDGQRFNAEAIITALYNDDGRLTGYSKLIRDITERVESDERFRQTQKLESLGVLAGGVAHDFNNLLTGIIGNCCLALETLPESRPERRHIGEAVKASERAAGLTQQLLSYAGKGEFCTSRVNLSKLTNEISSLISTSVPKNVELVLDLDPNVPAVNADAGQIQQIVMNLVINGAEASGEREGRVTVRTGVTSVASGDIQTEQSGEVKPGRYVYLEVQDNGVGMDETIRDKIFDPFFTTKFQGRGLGLSAVLGIVRRHDGFLCLDSTAGSGTVFQVLFPALAETAVDFEAAVTLGSLRGSGTVLVVDDEEIVRKTAKAGLERCGYTVLLASNGREAVDLFRERANSIGVVLMDLAMPVMNGPDALKEIRAVRANIPAIFTSGFDQEKIVEQLTRGSSLTSFIQKPYNPRQLAEKVRSVMPRERALRRTRRIATAAPAAFQNERRALGSMKLLFDERFQSAKGGVPLLGNPVETAVRHFQASRFQFPNAFAPVAAAAHQTCVGEGLQVLGDRLACDLGPVA